MSELDRLKRDIAIGCSLFWRRRGLVEPLTRSMRDSITFDAQARTRVINHERKKAGKGIQRTPLFPSAVNRS